MLPWSSNCRWTRSHLISIPQYYRVRFPRPCSQCNFFWPWLPHGCCVIVGMADIGYLSSFVLSVCYWTASVFVVRMYLSTFSHKRHLTRGVYFWNGPVVKVKNWEPVNCMWFLGSCHWTVARSGPVNFITALPLRECKIKKEDAVMLGKKQNTFCDRNAC